MIQKNSLKLFQKLINNEYIRYLIAGGTAFISDYLVLAYFNKILGVGTGVSGALGFITGLVASFIINRTWTFKSGASKKINKQAIEYILLVIFNFIFTVGVLVLLDNYVSPLIIKPVIVAVITIWNYIIYKKIIFRSLGNL